MSESSRFNVADKPLVFVAWLLWLAFLWGNLLLGFLFLPAADTSVFDVSGGAGLMDFTGISLAAISVVIRLFITRLRGQAVLVALLFGLVLAESCALIGLFFGVHWALPLYALGVFVLAIYIPIGGIARCFSDKESGEARS